MARFIFILQNKSENRLDFLPYLVYFFDAPLSSVPENSVSLEPCGDLLSFEKGVELNYDGMPKSIQQKFIDQEKLSPREEVLLHGLRNLQRARKLPVEERALPFAVVPDYDSFVVVPRFAAKKEEYDGGGEDCRGPALPGCFGLAPRLVSSTPMGDPRAGWKEEPQASTDKGGNIDGEGEPMEEDQAEKFSSLAPIPDDATDQDGAEEESTELIAPEESTHLDSSSLEQPCEQEVESEKFAADRGDNAAEDLDKQQGEISSNKLQQPPAWRGQPIVEEMQASRKVPAKESVLVDHQQESAEASAQHQRAGAGTSPALPLIPQPAAAAQQPSTDAGPNGASQSSSTSGSQKQQTETKTGRTSPVIPLRQRILPLGCIHSKRVPELGFDGRYLKPSGGQPEGYDWDAVAGVWAPEKKKKTKKLKEPKGKSTAYNLFSKEEREKISKIVLAEEGDIVDNDPDSEDYISPEKKQTLKYNNGKVCITEVTKLVRERWRKLDAARRAHFSELAAADYERYNKEMVAYNQKKRVEVDRLLDQHSSSHASGAADSSSSGSGAKKREQSVEPSAQPSKRPKPSSADDNSAVGGDDMSAVATVRNENKGSESTHDADKQSTPLDSTAAIAAAPPPSVTLPMKREEADLSSFTKTKKDSEEIKRTLSLKDALQKVLPFLLSDDKATAATTATTDPAAATERGRLILESLLALSFNRNVKTCRVRPLVKKLKQHPTLGKLAQQLLMYWNADRDTLAWREALDNGNLDMVLNHVKVFYYSMENKGGGCRLSAELAERVSLAVLLCDTDALFQQQSQNVGSGGEQNQCEHLKELEIMMKRQGYDIESECEV